MAKFLDQVSSEQKVQIKKTSSQRLFKWLVDVGMSEDDAERLNREQLMEAWAEMVFTGKDKKSEEQAEMRSIDGSDDELLLRREELDLRRAELDLRRREVEQKDDKAKRKSDLEKTMVYRAKLFGDALRGTMSKMPQDAIELVPYFRSVEQLYVDFGVEKKLRVHLLKPHLTEAARVLIARMDPTMASDYDLVKAMLLHEFKLSPVSLLDKFNVIARKSDETYTIFANRLKSLLTFYVEAREADSHDLLLDLLVCDRVKSTLTEGALRHILSLENKSKGSWLRLSDLVEALDLYYDTHLGDGEKPRNVSAAVSSVGSHVKSGVGKNVHQLYSTPKTGSNKTVVEREASNGNVSGTKRACYICGSFNHLQNFHAKDGNKSNTSSNSKSYQQSAMKRVNAVSSSLPFASPPVEGVGESACSMATESVDRASRLEATSLVGLNSVSKSGDVNMKAFVCDVVVSECNVTYDHVECDIVRSIDSEKSKFSDFSNLQFLDVRVSDDNNVCCEVSALNDGGAEVCLANSSVLSALNLIKIGNVSLSGAVGRTVEADLVKLIPVGIEIVCAVSDTATHPLILSSEIYYSQFSLMT